MIKRIIHLIFICLLVLPIINAVDIGTSDTTGVIITKGEVINIITGNLTNFTDLIDTPGSFGGAGGECVKVNAGANALEFGVCATGAGDFSFSDYQASFDLNLTNALPLENKTSVACQNITGTISDLCTIIPTGNASWNESGARDIFLEGIEAELNVNSSDNWDALDTINATQMEDNSGVLNILESWLTTFINTFNFITGNLFDQSLNTTDNVTFDTLNLTDWSNATITEIQISDLVHTTDTNASECGNGEYLDGTGNCINFNDTVLDITKSITYNATSIATVAGTVDSGDVESTWVFGDGDTYNISELANQDFIIYINYTNIEDFDGIALRVWYEGNDDKNHDVDICLWDWDGGVWDCEYHRSIPYTNRWETLTPAVLDPSLHIGTGGEDGEVRLSLQHDNSGDKGRSSHDFYVDYVVLTDGFSALTTTAPFTLQQVVDANPNLISNILSTANITANFFFALDWENVTITEDQITDLAHTGNESWNQSLADSFYALLGYGDDWNKTYADTLYSTGTHTVIWDADFNTSFDARDQSGGGNPFDQDLNTTANPTFAGLISTSQIVLNSVGANYVTATNANGDLQLGAGGGTNDLRIDTDGNVYIYEDLEVSGYYLGDGSELTGINGDGGWLPNNVTENNNYNTTGNITTDVSFANSFLFKTNIGYLGTTFQPNYMQFDTDKVSYGNLDVRANTGVYIGANNFANLGLKKTSTGTGDFIYWEDRNLVKLGSIAYNGNINTVGDIQAVTANLAGLDISNDGTKTTFLGTAGDYNRIGDAGTTSNSFDSEDDLLITGDLEVKGNVFFDGFGEFHLDVPEGNQWELFTFRENGGEQFVFNPNFLYDQLVLGITPNLGNQMILTNFYEYWRDFDHSNQANPTFFIHSATNPDSDPTQWISLTHDQTNAVIDVGTGYLEIKGDASDISLYVEKNISATGFITRTSIFDKAKNVWDYIKDASYYKKDNEIEHDKFYGYAGEVSVTDYDRPEIEKYVTDNCTQNLTGYREEIREECSIGLFNKITCINVTDSFPEYESINCVKIIEERTIYPYKKLESGVELGKEIDVLRQAVYELNERLKVLEEMCVRK